MSGGRKRRKSVPVSKTVAVSTREVNVAVEGVDHAAIAGSFTVHLLKDGARIASRFFFQPSGEGAAVMAGGRKQEKQAAHFDFLLPFDVVAEGELSVEIEPLEPLDMEPSSLFERLGRPTLSIYLMLESDDL